MSWCSTSGWTPLRPRSPTCWLIPPSHQRACIHLVVNHNYISSTFRPPTCPQVTSLFLAAKHQDRGRIRDICLQLTIVVRVGIQGVATSVWKLSEMPPSYSSHSDCNIARTDVLDGVCCTHPVVLPGDLRQVLCGVTATGAK